MSDIVKLTFIIPIWVNVLRLYILTYYELYNK